jgi:hypothetical protein
MKIPESIIEKLQLYPSGEQCGTSFINNLIVYKSRLPVLANNRVMECDLSGADSKYITILNTIDQNAFQTTVEYLADTDIELVLASII